MRGVTGKVRGITLLEALIYLFISSVLIAIFATSFLGAKRSVETMVKEQKKIDFVWKLSGIYDYLLASEANLLSGLKRIYLEDDGIYIPVVSPYERPYFSLNGAPDGFYAGECNNGRLSLYLVRKNRVSNLHGGCSRPPFYYLGYGGIPAFAAIKSGQNGERMLVEGVEGRTYITSLGQGSFSLEMRNRNGTPAADSTDAVFLSIKFTPENLEVSTWRAE